MVNPNNIPKNQVWCCANGCGECKPVETDFEYYREETFSGELISSLSEKIWVSDCCKAAIMLWDENLKDFVNHNYETL